MSSQGDFFHAGTEKKLKAIAGYLAAYQKVLTKFRATGGKTIYFDAFAGTGDLPKNIDDGGLLKDVEELSDIAEGSARRALAIEPSFSEFVFVEASKGKADELKRIKIEFPTRANSIRVIHGDANAEVLRFCNETDWSKNRAVVFLDPFGNQVKWSTIARIAKCNIDLWYLFPAHLGINRQISNSCVVEDAKAASLDSVFGTSTWRDEFLKRDSVNLLDGTEREVYRKQANADIVTRFMIRRMKEVFQGGVLDAWLPLGKNRAHWYSLIFAWGNKSPRAGEIASSIAKHLMQRK